MNFLQDRVINYLERQQTYWVTFLEGHFEFITRDYPTAIKLIEKWVIQEQNDPEYILEYWNSEKQMYQPDLERFFQTPKDEIKKGFAFRKRDLGNNIYIRRHKFRFFILKKMKISHQEDDLPVSPLSE